MLPAASIIEAAIAGKEHQAITSTHRALNQGSGPWLQFFTGLASSDPGEAPKPSEALLDPRSLRLAELSDLAKPTGKEAEPGASHPGIPGCPCNLPAGLGRRAGGRQAPPRAQEGGGRLSAARPSDSPQTPGGPAGARSPHRHPASHKPPATPPSESRAPKGRSPVLCPAAPRRPGSRERSPRLRLRMRVRWQRNPPFRSHLVRPCVRYPGLAPRAHARTQARSRKLEGGTGLSRHVRERGVKTQEDTAAEFRRL